MLISQPAIAGEGHYLSRRAASEGLTNPNFKALIENGTHNGACAAAQCCRSTAARRLLSSPPKMISRFVLFYDYTPDARRRRPFASLRRRRRDYVCSMAWDSLVDVPATCWRSATRTERATSASSRRWRPRPVLSAGAFTDPVDGAMFVFTDREAADEFKAKGPVRAARRRRLARARVDDGRLRLEV